MRILNLAPPLRGQTPTIIGPYQVGERLGEGGMGIVYRAVHRVTGDVVALKTVRQTSAPLLEAVRREIHALSSLDHEGIVAIRDSGVEQLSPWFAMELLERRTVENFRQELWAGQGPNVERTTLLSTGRPALRGAGGVPIPPPPTVRAQAAAGKLTEVLVLVSRISAALAHVHGEGLVHRDIKPDNIFLRADGRPVLVDFGLTAWFGGAVRGERLDAARLRAGTIPFMAPEVIRSELADARADLYALGCLFHLLVTGRLPFDARDDDEILMMHLERDPTTPSTLVDGVPRAVDQLIRHLLAKTPEARIGHALDVVDALAPLIPAALLGSGAANLKRFYLYRPRLAGRHDVRTDLDQRLARLKQGHGGLVFLAGESGAGKTFLANDVAGRAERMKLEVVTGECEPLATVDATGSRDEHNVPFHPFRRFFRAIVDRCLQGDARVTRRLLGDHAPLLARYHRPFATLLPRGDRQTRVAPDGDEARSAGMEAMVATLGAFAAERPAVLILDDLQWADALTLDLLRFLPPAFFAACPLLIVGTVRTEEVGAELGALLARADARRIDLTRLGREGVARQIEDMLAISDAPAALVDYLYENSEGVPFFVAEYLRAAMEKEVLRRRNGRWLVSETGESLDRLGAVLDLPRALQDLVAGRLDALSRNGTVVAITAAVLGRDLDAAVLAETADQTPDDLLAGLTELLRRQVLEQPAPGRYRFVHDKLREVVHRKASPEERARFHGRAGEVLERRGDDPDVYPALAQHFRISGDAPRAVHYSRLAGKVAWTAGSFQDARQHLGRAIELSPPRSVRQASPAERLVEGQTRHWLASSLFCSGEVDQAIDRFAESLLWLGVGPLPRSRGGWSRLTAALVLRQIFHRWFPSAAYRIRGGGVARQMAAEAAQIAVRLSWSFAFRYRLSEMLASVLLAANLSDRASALGPLAAAHSALGCFIGHVGMGGAAARYFDRARRSAIACEDPTAVVRAAQAECVLHLNQAQWEKLRSSGEPALARGLELGATHDTEALAQALSTASTLTGDLTGGEQQARALADTAGRLGHHLQYWWGRLTVAATIFRRGDFAEVSAMLVAVEKGCRERQDVVSHLECLSLMAAAAQRRGEGEVALDIAERARTIAAERGAGSLFGYSFHWLLPEIYAAEAARWSRGAADRRTLIERFEQGRRSAERFARMCRVARPFSLLHRGRSFDLAGRPAKALVAFRASQHLAAELGMPFDEALAELALARCHALAETERDRHEQRARAIFDQLGCDWLRGPSARTNASGASRPEVAEALRDAE